VEALARALAEEFRDPGSVRFYAHLLWGALLASLLKREGLLDQIRQAPQWRVA
jgi:hypothetical protein